MSRQEGEAVRWRDRVVEAIPVMSVPGFLVLVAVLIAIFIPTQFAESEALREAYQDCQDAAHERGTRFLEYNHEYGECWVQKPDGTIEDLHRETP